LGFSFHRMVSSRHEAKVTLRLPPFQESSGHLPIHPRRRSALAFGHPIS
jgi:hypothetical protein